MQQLEKSQIKDALVSYVKRYDSQNAAANSLRDISSATISQVLNNNWEQISDPMWRKISKQIGFKLNAIKVAETSAYRKAFIIFGDSQRNPQGIRAIVCNASLGKDTSIRGWCNSQQNSYHIDCHRQMSVRVLLRDMLRSMGKDSSGTVPEMLDNVVKYLERDSDPMFIINEVDKLRDEVLELFIDLENKLHGKCGLVWMATPYLKKRIELGVARGKRGFAELYSRVKKMFLDITPTRKEFAHDVALICKGYGITNSDQVVEFTNKTDDDFRVLTDLINAFKSH
ncbi:MAG: AAA family ATPase [Sediminibacterium sp.]|nr:AAA family ATPase [Sediminibacterium sp.]MDP3128126.1 AAA family ATPase [Sediminibacterium sp.]